MITSNSGIPTNNAWTSRTFTSKPYQPGSGDERLREEPKITESRKLRGALIQIAHPCGVEFLDGGQQPPVLTLGRAGHTRQRPAELAEQPVRRAVVTGRAAP